VNRRIYYKTDLAWKGYEFQGEQSHLRVFSSCILITSLAIIPKEDGVQTEAAVE